MKKHRFSVLFSLSNRYLPVQQTERHCAKYVQSKAKNKFCKTKCVKLNFYKCVILFRLLSTLSIYHFYCFSISFPLLYLSFRLDSLHTHPLPPPWYSAFFLISTKIPDQDFREIVTLVQKRTLPFVTNA